MLFRSLEHIVPYSLGGSGAFAIDYCSKKANNDFGSSIDAPFLELPLVGFKRHELGLHGYGGKVPDLVFQGECVELQKRAKVVFPYQGAPYADFGIQVSGGFADGKMQLSGTPERVKQAAKDALKKARNKGLTLKSAAFEPLTSVAEMLSMAQVSSGQTLHFDHVFDYETFFVPWARGITKMALGLGAKVLGKSWAFSASADKLRTALLLPPEELRTFPLSGEMQWRMPDALAHLLAPERGKHYLAVLPREHEMIAIISLFGGELFDCYVSLGTEPADVNLSNDRLPPGWECAYIIDPLTRAVRSITAGEIHAQLGDEGLEPEG